MCTSHDVLVIIIICVLCSE